jgi:murein DD-endopeptidase MepM/ murein hydrolase activator NlpD
MARGIGRDRSQRGYEAHDDPDDQYDGRGRSQYAAPDDRYDARRDGGRANPYDDRAQGPWAEEEGYDDSPSQYGGALVPAGARGMVGYDDESAEYPVPYGGPDSSPFIIPGSGDTQGLGLLPRRERPLVMRLAITALTVCVVLTGLFAVAPLAGGAADAHTGSPFAALAGAVVWHAAPDFRWYTALPGDTLESIATKFNAQVGGIYEMNNMLSGEEMQVGKSYKIPNDPNYGLYYRPASFVVTGYGTTTYGDSPWTSLAGVPPDGALCAPNGNGAAMGYKLGVPNPGAYWVRGFTWYHNGADLANVEGTPIHAAQAGEVIFSGWDGGGGGWTIKINHCNHVSTFYAHMDTLLAKVHQMVNQGDIIGLEGSTGWSTGPHLHYTIEWDNNPVDPLAYYCWNTDMITGRAPINPNC